MSKLYTKHAFKEVESGLLHGKRKQINKKKKGIRLLANDPQIFMDLKCLKLFIYVVHPCCILNFDWSAFFFFFKYIV